MMIPISLLSSFEKAYQAGKQGKYEEGKSILLSCLAYLDRDLLMMQPDEQMEILGCAANTCMECLLWDKAILLFERVCSLSEKLDPYAIETAGDYCSLGICHMSLKQWENALTAFQRSREILIQIDGEESFLEEVNHNIAELGQKIEQDQKIENTTNPELINMLNRRQLNSK